MKFLMSISEVCAAVSLSESKVRAMIKEGIFPSSILVGGSARWKVSDIAAWSDSLGAIPEKKKTGRPRMAV